MKTGIELIAEERQRQIEVEGYSLETDKKYNWDELAKAASCYALPEGVRGQVGEVPNKWPWPARFFKPTPDDRVRELVKAGALIAAEIDRLQSK